MSVNANPASLAIPATVAVDRFGVSAVVPVTAVNVDAPSLPQPSRTAATEQAPEPVQLAQAVDDLNQRAKASRTDLRFEIDEDSGQTVIAVVDAGDGTVLRQMPSEEALRIAKALDRALGTLIERVA